MMVGIAVAVISLMAAATIVIAVAYWRHLAKYRNLRLTDMRRHLEMLLQRGHDRAFLSIREMHSERFVQFAKYIRPDGECGVWLGFPRAPWSEPYYGRLLEEFRRVGVEVERQETVETLVTEFTIVDCGEDMERAMALVEIIFLRIFRSGPDVRLNVLSEGISP